MILVGTTGFQYRDWVPVFYPKDLDPCLWLQFYCRQFGCCEIGSTYYRIPETTTIQQLIDYSGRAFRFVFRIPFRVVECPEDSESVRKFCASLWPMRDSGQLAGVLAQFPPEFGFIRDNFDRLCRLRASLDGLPLIAEFGCPDWLTSKASKHLKNNEIALACVDGETSLRERVFYCSTADLAYVRFQGRNHSRWIKGDGSAQHDYLYSRAELEAAVPEIRRLEQESELVLVLMNNPWRGQAVINARMLLELLDRSCGKGVRGQGPGVRGQGSGISDRDHGMKIFD
ncbi:MAG TPA: DUF72 domain-containing protein [Acidobacteriota bacterium]|nr:DUF72 domain-containing protein [Acidobacteriota bacterium]